MADGTLVFDTKIDTEGVNAGMAKAEIKLNKATNAVKNQTREVIKLEAELNRFQSIQVPSEQYARLEAAMQKADSRLMALIDRQDRFLTTGGVPRGGTWERLQYDIELTAAKVRDYQAQMANMRADGSAFIHDGTAVIELNAKLDTAKIKLDELRLKEQEAGQALKTATDPARMELLSASTKKASGAFSVFKKRIAAVIRSALIFTAITRLLSKFRDYVSEAAIANSELRTALGRVKGALQSAFTPIFNAVLPALTALANALATAISYISAFFSMLGGGTKRGGVKAALQSTASELNDETAALMGVSDAAQNAEKSLAGFDEINRLEFDKAGGGGSGGGGAADIPAIDPGEVALPGWLAEIAEKLAETFERIAAAAKRLGQSKAFKALMDFLKFVAKTVAIEALDRLAGTMESLASGFEFWDKIFSGDFGGAAKSWWDSIKEIWLQIDPISRMIKTLIELFGTLKGKTNEAWESIKAAFGENWQAIVDWWNSSGVPAWWENSVKPWFTKEKWSGLWIQAKNAFSGCWQDIVDWWNTSGPSVWWNEGVKPWFTKERWSQLWNDVKKWFSEGWDSIKTWWNSTALVKWFNNDVKPWFTREKWSGLWDSVKQWFSDGWQKIKDWWNNSAVVRWWNDDVKPWFTKDKWTELLSSIPDAFKQAFDSAVSFVKSILNSLIRSINSFFHISTPGIKIAGKEIVPAFSTQLISIPYLAQGAVIPPNREFLAVLGDQKRGTNIEAPLDTIVSAFNQALGNNGNLGGRDITVVLEMDRTEFARAVYKANNSENQRVGLRLAGAY